MIIKKKRHAFKLLHCECFHSPRSLRRSLSLFNLFLKYTYFTLTPSLPRDYNLTSGKIGLLFLNLVTVYFFKIFLIFPLKYYKTTKRRPESSPLKMLFELKPSVISICVLLRRNQDVFVLCAY